MLEYFVELVGPFASGVIAGSSIVAAMWMLVDAWKARQ
jgi:hypothetical protein